MSIFLLHANRDPNDDSFMLVDDAIVVELKTKKNGFPVYRVLESNLFFVVSDSNKWVMSSTMDGNSCYFFGPAPCPINEAKEFTSGSEKNVFSFYPLDLQSIMVFWPSAISLISAAAYGGGYDRIQEFELPTESNPGKYPIWENREKKFYIRSFRSDCQFGGGSWVITQTPPHETVNSYMLMTSPPSPFILSPILCKYKRCREYFNRHILPGLEFKASSSHVLGYLSLNGVQVSYSQFFSEIPSCIQYIHDANPIFSTDEKSKIQTTKSIEWMFDGEVDNTCFLISLPSSVRPTLNGTNSTQTNAEEVSSDFWLDTKFSKETALVNVISKFNEKLGGDIDFVDVRKLLPPVTVINADSSPSRIARVENTTDLKMTMLQSAKKNAFQLFNGISVEDVCQGLIGNCWFIAGVSAMAEFPLSILSPFVEHLEEISCDLNSAHSSHQSDIELLNDIREFKLKNPSQNVKNWFEGSMSNIDLINKLNHWLLHIDVNCPLMPSNEPTKIRVFNYDQNLEGHFETIQIDQRVPSEPTNWYTLRAYPVFAKPIGEEAWTLLLEKAIAKMFGNFGNLEGGQAYLSWLVFAGSRDCLILNKRTLPNNNRSVKWDILSLDSPTVFKRRNPDERNSPGVIKFRSNTTDFHPSVDVHVDVPACFSGIGKKSVVKKSEVDHSIYLDSIDAIFELLKEADDLSLLMSAAISNNEHGEHKRSDGLIENHAYSLLSVHDEFDDAINRNVQLVKLRNPWKQYEFTGDYSDNWEGWSSRPLLEKKLFPPDLRSSRGDEGIFYLEINNFLDIFSNVDICLQSQRPTEVLKRNPQLWDVVNRIIDSAISQIPEEIMSSHDSSSYPPNQSAPFISPDSENKPNNPIVNESEFINLGDQTNNKMTLQSSVVTPSTANKEEKKEEHWAGSEGGTGVFGNRIKKSVTFPDLDPKDKSNSSDTYDFLNLAFSDPNSSIVHISETKQNEDTRNDTLGIPSDGDSSIKPTAFEGKVEIQNINEEDEKKKIKVEEQLKKDIIEAQEETQRKQRAEWEHMLKKKIEESEEEERLKDLRQKLLKEAEERRQRRIDQKRHEEELKRLLEQQKLEEAELKSAQKLKESAELKFRKESLDKAHAKVALMRKNPIIEEDPFARLKFLTAVADSQIKQSPPKIPLSQAHDVINKTNQLFDKRGNFKWQENGKVSDPVGIELVACFMEDIDVQTVLLNMITP